MTISEKIKVADKIVDLLENKFKVFGYKFGLDPLIGLIPVVGDIVPFAMSFYLIAIAYQANVSSKVILKMCFITLIDFLIGVIPIIGDLSDFVFRAHLKNLQILKRELSI